jgi:hypothetical protein
MACLEKPLCQALCKAWRCCLIVECPGNCHKVLESRKVLRMLKKRYRSGRRLWSNSSDDQAADRIDADLVVRREHRQTAHTLSREILQRNIVRSYHNIATRWQRKVQSVSHDSDPILSSFNHFTWRRTNLSDSNPCDLIISPQNERAIFYPSATRVDVALRETYAAAFWLLGQFDN